MLHWSCIDTIILCDLLIRCKKIVEHCEKHNTNVCTILRIGGISMIITGLSCTWLKILFSTYLACRKNLLTMYRTLFNTRRVISFLSGWLIYSLIRTTHSSIALCIQAFDWIYTSDWISWIYLCLTIFFYSRIKVIFS